MRSDASRAEDYLADLPPERRSIVESVRETILDHLPQGYEETIDHGMLAYVVPLSRYPDTYNGHPLMYAALASQKRHMAVYLMGLYGDNEEWFRAAYEDSDPGRRGKRLDLGKSCWRFTEDWHLDHDLLGRTIERCSIDDFVRHYEATRA